MAAHRMYPRLDSAAAYRFVTTEKYSGEMLDHCIENITFYIYRLIHVKLIVAQLVRKFSAFRGARSFITVFTKSHHWTLS